MRKMNAFARGVSMIFVLLNSAGYPIQALLGWEG
jgi:hypothetical protein